MTKIKRLPWLFLALSLVYVFSVPGPWLVGTRITILAVGIFAILAYMSESRTQPFATAMAILIAGASLAMITQAFTNFVTLSAEAEPWLVLLLFAYTNVLLKSRGNLAKLFARAGQRSTPI